MAYRNDVDALAARTDALAAEVKAKTRELDQARAVLDEAVAKSKRPVLPNIRVATPCPADWNAMTPVEGAERVRACASCNKNVYNLSTLTREEAEALIIEKEGRLCVRYFQRKDGTILLKDCAIGITQKRKRRVLAAGVLALLGGSSVAAIKLSRDARAVPARLEISPAPEITSTNPTLTVPVELPPPPQHEDVVETKGKVDIDEELRPTMGDVAFPDDEVR